MERKRKAVVVGTSYWAETHIQAWRQCSGIELAGLCGHQNTAGLNELADRYQIPHRSLHLAELLEEVRPEILDVACSPLFRLEAVKIAANSPSVQIVNLEKPLALTLEEAYEIEKLCKTCGLQLTVNHQKKYLPAWRRAKQLIDEGRIGQARFFRATCKGNILEQGTHLLDMVLYFNRYEPVDWVMGQIGELEEWGRAGIFVPEATMGVVVFRDKSRAVLEFGSAGRELPGEANKWYQFSVEIYGDAGHIKVSLNQELEVVTYADGRRFAEPSDWERHYVQAMACHLNDAASYAVRPEEGHISDLSKSLLSFKTLMAIFESGLKGGKISLRRMHRETS